MNRLKELVPTVQFYSSNPRNSAINIRGLGAPYGLTNDGIDPGVGLYIDGTFFARPAAATLDFLDVERVEVLRGPQGTLFGKNTTAGAINVTTRKPSFTPETVVELNFGSLDLVQAKASVGGALSETVAGRISFSGTTRHGAITDVATNDNLNGLNNLGFRGQLDWDPSTDRDFIGLPVTTISANPSKQRQWTQEVRYAGDVSPALGFVVGAFAFRQTIHSTGNQEQGSAAARFLLTPSALAATPGLLDGYGQTSDIQSTNVSAALFGQLEWSVTNRFRLLPGLRFNYDDKSVDYDSEVYGGLQTTDPALIALQRSILAPQAYQAGAADTNVSGQLTAAYQLNPRINAYATYAASYKPIGLNLSGVPTDALGRPALDAATVKPEDEHHIEIGVKTEPLRGVTANVTVFNTDIKDYHANVVNAQVGVLRGYLANAEKVRVRGAEFDGSARVNRNLSLYGSAAYTDGVYVSFPDAPPPLEETGGPQVKDISGSDLPGISKWALSWGGEYAHPRNVFGRTGELFSAIDASYRSSFSSSATASKYLVIDGYALLNARVGFRWADGWSLSLWSRNLLDKNYFELLSAAPGGSGLYVGLPGDPRTVGVTLRMSVRSRK